MPFDFQPYRSTLTNTIAQTMLRRGEIAAREAEQTGAGWAQALGLVGQIAGQLPGQIQQAKRAGLQDQLLDTNIKSAQIGLGEQEHVVAARAALTSAVASTPMVNEGGASLFDIPTIAKRMSEIGFAGDLDKVVKELGGLNDAYRTERAAKMATVQRGAQAIIASGNDQTLALHFLDTLEANQSFPKETVDKYRQFISADPANVAKLTASLAGPQQIDHAPPGSSLFNKGTGAVVGTVPAKPEHPTEASLAFDAAGGNKQAAAALPLMRPLAFPPVGGPEDYDKRALSIATTRNGGPLTPEQEQKVIRDARQEYAASGHVADPDPPIHLTPEAKTIAAKNYAMTGQLSALGNGKNAANAKTEIMNEAGRIYANLDLASSKAAYKANQESLVALQKQTDAVTAFEKTAGKNLDMFLSQAQKVIDLGSPWINRPLQTVNKNLLGDEDQPAYEAAKMVALTEIAKITSNPNLTGQLSDSARQEVASFVPAGATLKATYNVAKVLVQDMKNRRDSLNEQIVDIQKRIATPPGGIATPAEVNAPSNEPRDGDVKPIPGYPGTEMTYRDGKWIRTK